MSVATKLIREVLNRTGAGYRYLLRRDFAFTGPHGRPEFPNHNGVLQSEEEVEAVLSQLKSAGLPPASDRPKNWDALAALDLILGKVALSGRVLDAGAEVYSRLLPWLALYRYENLFGINLTFERGKTVRQGPIQYTYGDITQTEFPDGYFDAITCLSVIEHGVDPEKYFREMSRILKPGGNLVTSTDYWEDPVDTAGKEAYGVPVKLFSRTEITERVRIAGSFGLEPTGELALSCDEKVVHWKRLGLDFTFVVFTLRKTG